MANEKNNTNELVSTGDESAADPQELTLQQVLAQSAGDAGLEDDADTFEFERMPGRRLRQAHVAVLNVDLESRAQRIERLQFDLEAFRSRFNGLKVEIRAREEITDDLRRELAGVKELLLTRSRQVQQRDRAIADLKAEIRARASQSQKRVAELEAAREERDRLGGELAAIQAELETLTSLPVPAPGPEADGVDASKAAIQARNTELKAQLDRTEAYADEIRIQLADRSEHAAELEKQLGHVRLELAESETLREQQAADLATRGADNRALAEQIGVMQARQNDELQTLRGDLAASEEARAELELAHAELTADLLEAQGHREEIERLFEHSDEQYQQRIRELEDALAGMTKENADNVADLRAKTEALNALVAELSRAGEPGRNPGRRKQDPAPPRDPDRTARERVNRMLIGSIDNQELRFPLFKKRLTIGRTRHNDIQLNVPHISRRHAVVLTEGDATRVVDWGSKNGVYVNSRRITEHFLKTGDRVTIGNAEFRYEERPRRDA